MGFRPRTDSVTLPRKDGGVTYLIDVRSENEYEKGHIPGSLNIPGGQAVQRADDFVAVKNSRIIFVSHQSVARSHGRLLVPANGLSGCESFTRGS